MGVERQLSIKKGCGFVAIHQAQRVERFFQRRTFAVFGSSPGCKRGESGAFGGTDTSNNASVGHEPMQDKQPTHRFSTTTTGRFGWVRPVGFSTSGSRASNGQW